MKDRYSFTKDFIYLGSNIDFIINNTMDVWNRVLKANKAMSILKFVWYVIEVPLAIKIKLY